jgi:hypothetical protein
MSPAQALDFVRDHGVVLASAHGLAPSLADAVAGEPVRGSWWAHRQSRAIFAALQTAQNSPDILVCRVLGGRITLIHRRLWPALIRVSDRVPAQRLDWIHQTHTSAGHHENRIVPFPDWAPTEAMAAADGLAEDEAITLLGAWIQRTR